MILVSFNFSDIKENSLFLKKWGKKGGIYIIEYIHNTSIYYIGRTTLFKRRINNYIKADTKSKLHVEVSWFRALQVFYNRNLFCSI